MPVYDLTVIQNLRSDGVLISFLPPAGGSYEGQCARCGGEVGWVDCDECDDGLNILGSDCDVCEGLGGWYYCEQASIDCENEPREGREDVPPGEFIEWFEI